MGFFTTLRQSVGIALDMLRLHKLRAFLTMLGVIIGVMAVTIIVMVSNGFKAFVQGQFSKVGADTIYVFFDPGMRRRQTMGKIEGLTIADAEYLRSRVPELETVSAITQGAAAKVTFEGQEVNNPRVYGQDEDYSRINGEKVMEGRAISTSDMAERTNVCLIGVDLRDQLFPDKKAIGKLIQVPGITLEVVGVLEKMDVFGDTNAKDIRMPLTTYQQKVTGNRNVFIIAARPKTGIETTYAMDRVWEAMMLKSNNKRIYRVDSNESIMQVFGTVLGAAGTVLAAIAALSLLVGGIGIMNIMLVSVSERTREIGLRKAIGARGSTILLQFLVESATLSLVGGLIGMGMAGSLGLLVKAITAAKAWPQPGGLPTPFPVEAGIASAVFSALVGVVFGLYPAFSAAKMDPISALRRE